VVAPKIAQGRHMACRDENYVMVTRWIYGRSHERQKFNLRGGKPLPTKKNQTMWKIISLLLILILMSCAALQEMINIEKPTAKVRNVRLTGLSLQQIDLLFDVDIFNPNALSVNLAGFDYDFLLSGSSFLKGQQDKQLTIASRGNSNVEVPVSIAFKEIYQTYQSLKNQDSTDYKIICGLVFDLPVFGKTRIPVSQSGNLPLLKIPQISISSLKLQKLSLTSADLLLNLEVNNPNNFSLALNKLDYDFAINNLTWATGLSQQALAINKKGKSALSLPLSLNFISMGKALYQAVTGDNNLNYHLKGAIDLNTSVPLLKNFTLPIDQTGQIKVLK